MEKHRIVSRKKEDIHLTILVDGCPEDFKSLYVELKRAIHKRNAGADKKISFDINFLPTPEIWKEKLQESSCSSQVPLSEFLKSFCPRLK